MPDLADALFAFVALAIAIHVLTCLVAAARTLRGNPKPPANLPPVTLLRPVCGLDQHDALTLGSTFTLDYPRYDIVFCAAQPGDPAVALVKQLMQRYPHIPARLLVGDERVSPNPKLNNLVKGWNAPTEAWVVMADSNVLMPPDYLQRLFCAWTPDTGLVCSPPVGVMPDSFMAELEAAFLNTYQARFQLFADSVGFGFAQGKSMLWRRDLLDAAGGIAALGCELAEDAAATKIVRDLGLNVRLTRVPFAQPLGTRTAQQVWDRQVRWARLRRMTFPLAFAPEVLSGIVPPLAALLTWTHLTGTAELPAAATLLAIWYGIEALLSRIAGWPVSHRALASWALRDALLPLIWISAVAGSSLTWRGTDLKAARSN